jgi:hypothetical protein
VPRRRIAWALSTRPVWPNADKARTLVFPGLRDLFANSAYAGDNLLNTLTNSMLSFFGDPV